MFYTLSLESKKAILQDFQISLSGDLWQNCCDVQFMNIVFEEANKLN